MTNWIENGLLIEDKEVFDGEVSNWKSVLAGINIILFLICIIDLDDDFRKIM